MIADLDNPEKVLTYQVKVYRDSDFDYFHFDGDFIESDGSNGSGMTSTNEDDIVDFFYERLMKEIERLSKIL